MLFNYANKQGGLIKAILIVAIVLLILAYFGLNLRSIVNSPTFQDNWSFLWNGTVHIWDAYLKAPATYAWNFFVTYVWDPVFARLQSGQTAIPLSDPSQSPLLVSSSSPLVQ